MFEDELKVTLDAHHHHPNHDIDDDESAYFLKCGDVRFFVEGGKIVVERNNSTSTRIGKRCRYTYDLADPNSIQDAFTSGEEY